MPKLQRPRVWTKADERRAKELALPASGREGAQNADQYFERLTKYIPGEVIAPYLLVWSIFEAAAAKGQVPPDPGPVLIAWGLVLIFTILCVLWTLKTAARDGYRPPVKQAILATFAFLVWTFALGGPPNLTWGDDYHTWYGTVVLIITTVAIPLWDS